MILISGLPQTVRTRICTYVSLAGDGANDVPMIQRAHIGVGISGQEGMQVGVLLLQLLLLVVLVVLVVFCCWCCWFWWVVVLQLLVLLWLLFVALFLLSLTQSGCNQGGSNTHVVALVLLLICRGEGRNKLWLLLFTRLSSCLPTLLRVKV